MADLIVHAPGHSYSESDFIYVSWLDGNYYVRDVSGDTFKISTTDDDLNLVSFTTTITDGYVREVSTGSTTISGLDHLDGEIVTVVSGQTNYGTYTVSSGSITVSDELSTYIVGLPYKFKVRTMRLAVPIQGNTLQSRITRINELTTRYIKSKGGRQGQEVDGSTFYPSDMNCTFSSESQDVTTLTKGGYDDDGYVTVESLDPFPMSVISTIISFETYETR